MIATQNFNEGLDLKAVRHIHIFEPLVSMAGDLQTIGRARRYCSHQMLDKSKDEWNVRIWRYISVFGEDLKLPQPKRKKATNNGVVADLFDESIDELVYRTAREKYHQLFQINIALEKASMDRLMVV